jgi:hypothetical protein
VTALIQEALFTYRAGPLTGKHGEDVSFRTIGDQALLIHNNDSVDYAQ